MDGKVVSQLIRKTVWPRLRDQEFSKFSSRDAWRFGQAFCVVNFQSFNSYLANGLGCTTFSFAVNLGLNYGFMPLGMTTRMPSIEKPPRESECIFRKPLLRRLNQPGNKHPQIWKVDPSGDNAAECVSDALNVLLDEAMQWFELVGDLSKAVQIVEHEDEEFRKSGPLGTWGFGRPGSPLRQQTLGHLRTELDRQGSTGTLT
jgi:hypothetical protein